MVIGAMKYIGWEGESGDKQCGEREGLKGK